MQNAAGLISLMALIGAALALGRVLGFSSPISLALSTFACGVVLIVLIGVALSDAAAIDSVVCWAGMSVAALVAVLIPAVSVRRARERLFTPVPVRPLLAAARRGWGGLGLYPRVALSFLVAAVLVVSALNLVVVLGTAPHTWDSMAYRLARAAYYLQQGSLRPYDANYAQQVVVQQNAAILFIYLLVISGCRENLTQLLQYLSYFAATLSVYGISRVAGRPRSAALFAAGVFALLTECLLQSTTTQSDLFLTALVGVVVYALFAYRQNPHPRFLALAAFAFGLTLGTKASVLLLAPSLALIGGFTLLARRPGRLRTGVIFSLLLLAAIVLLVIPSGPGMNYRQFGHPLGPAQFREVNSFAGRSPAYIAINGTKHLLRSALDFLKLDGFPPLPAVNRLQRLIRYLPGRILRTAGVDLEEGIVEPWYFHAPPVSHEDYSSWGVLGFGLVWPALILGLLSRRCPPADKVLGAAAVLFVVVHAFSGVYDFAGRGRYVLLGAVLAVPSAAWIFPPRRTAARFYLLLLITLGCLSGVTAVLFRFRSPLLVDQSVFLPGELRKKLEVAWPMPVETGPILLRDRLGQLLRDGPIFEARIRKFEETVPPDAVVAACLNPNSFEYPLFGYKLTRTIIPINSYWKGLRPIPPNVDYLLWADDFDEIFNRQISDIHLGGDWYIRRLK